MPDSPGSQPADYGPEVLQLEHRLTRLLAMSFDGPSSPRIGLRAVSEHEPRDKPYGWGFAWYPEQGPSALVVKDPTSIGENAMTKLLSEWERFESTAFICHLRGAARALKEQDTQPFAHAYAGRDWVLAHNGDLLGELASLLPLGERPALEPRGRTDSEHAFCWLLEQLRAAGARRLSDFGYPRLHALLRQLDELGTTNLLLTDGIDIVAYHDASGYNGLAWTRLVPPHESPELSAPDLVIDLDDASGKTRTVVVVATAELAGADWTAFELGQMLVLRRGAVVFDSHAGRPPAARDAAAADGAAADGAAADGAAADGAAADGAAAEAPAPARRRAVGAKRRLEVVHETVYRYTRPVERSEHTFRLRPVHDRHQHLLEHELALSVRGLRRDVEDVFGNQTTHAELEQPYRELRILSRSRVELSTPPRLDLHAPERRFTLPLVWMPWQRQMMLPYLLPPELAETQLTELYAFAMSFVERNDGDLVQTLLDLNGSIYRDFRYASGSTTLATTPFEVYASRTGVCQDFANLLICLARLLNLPARYRVGYIFTGSDYANKQQGDASHAWAELYLPWMGWQGFDPTNGSLAGGHDHVRVACGRNYRDATPTAGTLFKGGGGEAMTVSVRVEERP